MNSRICALVVGLSCCLAVQGSTIQKARQAEPTKQPPAIEKITNSLYRVGKVIVDTDARTITCPAVINMDQGPIEYLGVAQGGKLHESLLRVDVRPLHLQIALLMLDLDPVNNIKYQGDSATPGGPRLKVDLRWRNRDGKQVQASARSLIETPRSKQKQKVEIETWAFTGSRILKQVGFEADIEKSLIAVWHDPSAIIDNAGPDGAENEHVVASQCPPRGTVVELVITAAKPDGGKK